MFETKLDSMVRDKVEQIVNAMLDEKADRNANAARYERSDGRRATTCGNYWQRRYACTMDTSLGHQAIGSSACARRVFNRAFC